MTGSHRFPLVSEPLVTTTGSHRFPPPLPGRGPEPVDAPVESTGRSGLACPLVDVRQTPRARHRFRLQSVDHMYRVRVGLPTRRRYMR